MSRKSSWFGLLILVVIVLSLPLLAQGPMNQRGYGQQQGARLHSGGVPGQGACAGSLDPANLVALEGIVEAVQLERGRGNPGFTMTADGKKVTIITSPYRALLDADYKIKIGDKMNVVAYRLAQPPDTYIAAELKNLTSGTVLTLRDAGGLPITNRRGCGNCPMRTAAPAGN